MKAIIIGLALIGLCNIAQAQYGNRPGRGNTGLAMTLGGVSIMIGGFVTRPEKYYTTNGVWEVKPFHRQGPRASAIVCGLSLTITGLITSLLKK